MADLLIAPEGYTTPGGVPRKLLAGVFLVVTLTALVTFMLTSSDEPLMTGDQKARAELKKPESVSSQARGNAQWVDDAADRARIERGVVTPVSGPLPMTPPVVVPASPPPAAMPDLPVRSALPSATSPAALPMLPSEARHQGRSAGAALTEVDAGAVERDRASRSASSTVFDEGGTSASPKDVRLESLPGDGLRRGSSAMASGADALAPVIDAIKAMHGQAAPGGAAGAAMGAAGTQTRAEGERQWAQLHGASPGTEMLAARPPRTDLMLFQGTVIPCVLARRINSDMPGVVTARVSMDVYDSRTSRRLLLPKGAMLVGAYNSDVQPGQSRIQFAFTRLKMPDGSTFDLPGAPGSDAAGQAGVEGDVDRHFFRGFGAALLLGVLADRVTRITALPNGGVTGQGGLSATGQVFVDTARVELERHRAIPPTVTLDEGTRINVEVVRDMGFSNIYREQASW